MKTMIYAGVNRGEGFFPRVKDFDRSIGFEANPGLCKILQETVDRHKLDGVEIVNAALYDFDGEIEFNLNTNDCASSIGKINNDIHPSIKTVRVIKVRSLNLLNFLMEQNIEHIDFYLSDLQGVDLMVLKTLQPFLNMRKIDVLQCEVGKDDRPPVYLDLYNKFTGFKELLSANYEIIDHKKVAEHITEDIVWTVKR
jgi:FkbM family methyltransferase